MTSIFVHQTQFQLTNFFTYFQTQYITNMRGTIGIINLCPAYKSLERLPDLQTCTLMIYIEV